MEFEKKRDKHREKSKKTNPETIETELCEHAETTVVLNLVPLEFDALALLELTNVLLQVVVGLDPARSTAGLLLAFEERVDVAREETGLGVGTVDSVPMFVVVDLGSVDDRVAHLQSLVHLAGGPGTPELTLLGGVGALVGVALLGTLTAQREE